MLQLNFSSDEGIIFSILGYTLCDRVCFSCLKSVRYFLNDVLSNLFYHLLISVWMPVAIFVARNRVWKPAFKTKLKHCDFYQLTLVSMEIFSNYLTRKIIFTDISK